MIEQLPASGPASARRRSRPPAPLEPSASAAARLGAELRALRAAHDLTLAGLAIRVGSDQEDDVDPINRRELAAAGAAAVLEIGAAAAPASARDVDPALPGH